VLGLMVTWPTTRTHSKVQGNDYTTTTTPS
jgi:hypothetical protein